MSGCSKYNCAVSGQTKKNDEQVIITQTITLVEGTVHVSRS